MKRRKRQRVKKEKVDIGRLALFFVLGAVAIVAGIIRVFVPIEAFGLVILLLILVALGLIFLVLKPWADSMKVQSEAVIQMLEMYREDPGQPDGKRGQARTGGAQGQAAQESLKPLIEALSGHLGQIGNTLRNIEEKLGSRALESSIVAGPGAAPTKNQRSDQGWEGQGQSRAVQSTGGTAQTGLGHRWPEQGKRSSAHHGSDFGVPETHGAPFHDDVHSQATGKGQPHGVGLRTEAASVDLRDLADAWHLYRKRSEGIFSSRRFQAFLDQEQLNVRAYKGEKYGFDNDYIVAVFPNGEEGALFPSFNLAPTAAAEFFRVASGRRTERIQRLIYPAHLVIMGVEAEVAHKGELQ